MYIKPLEEDTRLRILKTALKIFSERGFYEAKTRHIAGEAKVNLASLYYYFGSKEGLLTAIINELVAPEVKDSAKLLEETPKSLIEISEQLKRYLYSLLESYFKNTEIFDLYHRILDSSEAVPENILPLIGDVFGNLSAFLQVGKDQGLILQNGKSNIAAIMILTSFAGLIKNESTKCRYYPVSLRDSSFTNEYINQMIARVIY